ncbi:hypothetical protein ACVW00_003469 [Marmoricola sp. URHA0025 HA25]
MRAELRGRLRQLRDRWVDQTLVRVERARADLAGGTGDVLVLGESSCLAWAHEDTDRRLVPELIGEATGARVVTVAGAGYDARMFGEVLRVLGLLQERPRALVLAINVRTNTAVHVTRHPLHGHARSREALARLSPPIGRIRAVARGGGPRHGEIRAFRELPVETRWGGAATIDGYLSRLEGYGPPPWPVEIERLRFDYFHGEVVGEDNGGLAALGALGRRLTEYGVPAVAYWAQPPVQRGEELFPGEFAAHVQTNLARVETALLGDSVGPDAFLKPVLEEPDFQDHRNGTEHYSFTGRAKVADDVAKALARLGL